MRLEGKNPQLLPRMYSIKCSYSTIDTTVVPEHCPKGSKWPGDHLINTSLFNFSVQGNYLVRKFLKFYQFFLVMFDQFYVNLTSC